MAVQRHLSPLRHLARAWYDGTLERKLYLSYRRQLLDAIERGLPPPVFSPPERHVAPAATETAGPATVPASRSHTKAALLSAGAAVLCLALAAAWWMSSPPSEPAQSPRTETAASRSQVPVPPQQAAAPSPPAADAQPVLPKPGQTLRLAPAMSVVTASDANAVQQQSPSGEAAARMEARLREFMRSGQWNDPQAHSTLIVQWLDLSPPQVETLRGTATFRAFADALAAQVREARKAQKHELEAQLERLADRLGIRLPQAGAVGQAQLRLASGCGRSGLESGRLFCRDRLPHGEAAPLMQAVHPAATRLPYVAVSVVPLDTTAVSAFCRHHDLPCGGEMPIQRQAFAYAAWLTEVTGHPYHVLPSEAIMPLTGLVKPVPSGAIYLALAQEE